MYENQFDQVADEVSTVHELNWNEDTKIRLFARFLQESCPHMLQAWENWLENQADAELTNEPNDELLAQQELEDFEGLNGPFQDRD